MADEEKTRSYSLRYIHRDLLSELLRRIDITSNTPLLVGYRATVTLLGLSIDVTSPSVQRIDRPQYEAAVAAIVQQLVRTIYILHKEHKLVHGRITADCIYLDEERRDEGASATVRLGDHIYPPGLFIKRTPPYIEANRLVAPEIRDEAPYGYAADVWGIGVSVLSLLNDKPFDTDDIVDSDVASPLFTSLSPPAVSLLVSCFKANPHQRPRLEELLFHPFLQKYTKPAAIHRECESPYPRPMAASTLKSSAAYDSDEKEDESEESEDEDCEEEDNDDSDSKKES